MLGVFEDIKIINLGDWVIFRPKTLINERIFDDSNEKSVVRHVFLRQKVHIL